MQIESGKIAIDEKFIRGFIETTDEMLRQINETAIALESQPQNAEYINTLFRLFHTIKGNSSFFALLAIKVIAHALEDLLGAARSKRAAVDKRFLDLFWSGIQLLCARFEMVKSGGLHQELDGDSQQLVQRVNEYIADLADVPASPAVRSTDTQRFLCEDTDVSRQVFVLQATLEKCGLTDAEPGVAERFNETIADLEGVFLQKNKTPEAALAREIAGDFMLMISDEGTADKAVLALVRSKLAGLFAGLNKVSLVPPAPACPAAAPDPRDSSLRIQEKHIDDLLLSVKKLEKIGESFYTVRDQLNQTDLAPQIGLEMGKAINNLDYLCRDIFQMLVKIKLVSPKDFLEKNKRVIEQLAQACGKQVAVVTRATSMFVERRNLEILDGVLVHVLRNALDHGIESADERVQAGKTAIGELIIVLNENKECLQVQIADDGRGIDFEALKQDAVRKGKITDEQCRSMNDEEAAALLFLSGVSTAKKVTEISGRGVGLDAVNNAVKTVGGSMSVRAVKGKGTTVEIRLPCHFQDR
jgi:two-component system chemotaxis sensor kinase CheA